jgi:hypothetical protein
MSHKFGREINVRMHRLKIEIQDLKLRNLETKRLSGFAGFQNRTKKNIRFSKTGHFFFPVFKPDLKTGRNKFPVLKPDLKTGS